MVAVALAAACCACKVAGAVSMRLAMASIQRVLLCIVSDIVFNVLLFFVGPHVVVLLRVEVAVVIAFGGGGEIYCDS